LPAAVRLSHRQSETILSAPPCLWTKPRPPLLNAFASFLLALFFAASSQGFSAGKEP
jgi:hypothetical protein